MTYSKYQEKEDEFLKDIADELGIKGNYREVFLERFKRNNINDDHKKIADKLCLGEKTVRDYLSKYILPPMADKFKWTVKKRWVEARAWLEEEIFPKWNKSVSDYWQDLWSKANPTELIDIKVLKEPLKIKDYNLKVTRKGEPKNLVKTIPLGSEIQYQVKLSNSAYVIFLEHFTSGEVYCLSPSVLSPQFLFKEREVKIPQQDSEFDLTIDGEQGIEQVMALVTPKQPQWDWLLSNNDELLELKEEHLNHVLNYVESHPNCEVLRWEYRITA